jgi:hypothetical protein
MAKRPSSRSQADDTAAAAPPQKRPRRTKGAGAAQTPGAPDESPTENRGNARANAQTDFDAEQPESPEALTSESVSMGSEPSEDDIRMRAYHRFLERGGAPGSDFDDWLEAERELRSKKAV